jgi:hypothetical protein
MYYLVLYDIVDHFLYILREFIPFAIQVIVFHFMQKNN